MRPAKLWFAVVIALLTLTAPVTAADQRPLFAPGEVLLKFRPTAPEADRARLLQSFNLRPVRHLLGTRAQLLSFADGADPRDVAAWLRKHAGVEYAEPNYYRYLDVIPNDPRFNEMYGLDNTGQTGGTADADIDAPEAWDITTGSANVVVGSLDSSIDIDHEDLAPNLFVNPGEIPGNGIDDDGNGFVDDVTGWDFVDNDNNPNDPAPGCAGHGSHTSGTFGAVGNNNRGVIGVSPQVRILPVRAFMPLFGFLCTAEDADLIDGIGYLALMDVDVSNHSWGGGPFSQAMFTAISRARHLFVTSAGNTGSNLDVTPAYPASYDLDHIMTVSSTDHNDNLSGFSSFGSSSVEVAAPGSRILSTVLNNGYGFLDGTSMSAPHVAGVAALLLSQDPELTPLELKARIALGGDSIGIPVIGGKRLNARGALTVPAPTVEVRVLPVSPTTLSPGDLAEVDVELENVSGVAQTVEASLRVWTPRGAEVVLLGPASPNLAPGQILQVSFSQVLPATLPAGDYFVVGQATDGISTFDEDLLVLTVN